MQHDALCSAQKQQHRYPRLHIDSQAPLDFLFASADRRIRMARRLLECLDGADDSDVRYMANAALMLLNDGCDALDAVEKQVFRFVADGAAVRH